jgi:hypothetical protein
MKIKSQLLILSLLFQAFASYADVSISSRKSNYGTPQSGCMRSTSRTVMELNNVRALMLNAGDKWFSVFAPSVPRYEVPKQDNPYLPKKHSLFAGSLWIGGIDDFKDELTLVATTYRQSHYSLWPGPLKSNGATTNAQTCSEWDRHFKVSKADIQQFIIDFESGLIQTTSDVPESILKWPGKFNPHLTNEISDLSENLAPFTEHYSSSPDGIYDPMTGDIPDIKGDEAIWWVMNDKGNIKEFGSQVITYQSPGFEIQEMAYAFVTQDPVNDATFYDNKVINKSSRTIVDTYFGQWVDPDVGYAGDDYVECDVMRSMGIAYNGDLFDEGFNGYGSSPPAIGVDLLKGPLADFYTVPDGIDNDGDGLVDEGDYSFGVYEGDGIDNDFDGIVDELGETIGMTSFIAYNNSANPINGFPRNIQSFYDYLRGKWLQNTTITYDLKNGMDSGFPPATYMFPGDSYIQLNNLLGKPPLSFPYDTPWYETTAGNQPADRRFIMSSGPFTMEPGAIRETTIGVPWADSEGGDNRTSIDKLKCADDYIQALFDSDFEVLNGPDAPDIQILERNRELVISLHPSDFNVVNQGNITPVNTETYFEFDDQTNGFYGFEGYIVYQLRDQYVLPEELGDSTKARVIAISDLSNGISSISNNQIQFNGSGCNTISELMIHAPDTGLHKVISVSNDLFDNGNPLINYKRYYFAAVAYAYNAKADSLNLNPNINGNFRPYLQSRKNIRIYTGVPYNQPGPGINISSNFFSMKALSGEGNGGIKLELASGVENSILAGQPVSRVYSDEGSPLDIRVYNPFALQNDSIEVWLTSRLEYAKSSTSFTFLPGDTIESLGDFNSTPLGIVNKYLPQIPGKAIVLNERKDLETSNTITLEVRLLNDSKGGTFIRDSYKVERINGNTTFLGTALEPIDFWKIGDPGSVARCVDFH